MIILVVDDSETSRIILKTILNYAGYTDLLMAGSARAALDILNESTQDEGGPKVDLILMDIVMPGMTGIEATRAIKADGRWRDIPIIMVTVRNEGGQSLRRRLKPAPSTISVNRSVGQNSGPGSVRF